LWTRSNSKKHVLFSNPFLLLFKLEGGERGRGESVEGGGCHLDGETIERDFDASEGETEEGTGGKNTEKNTRAFV